MPAIGTIILTNVMLLHRQEHLNCTNTRQELIVVYGIEASDSLETKRSESTQQIRIVEFTLENDTFWSFSTISMRARAFYSVLTG